MAACRGVASASRSRLWRNFREEGSGGHVATLRCEGHCLASLFMHKYEPHGAVVLLAHSADRGRHEVFLTRESRGVQLVSGWCVLAPRSCMSYSQSAVIEEGIGVLAVELANKEVGITVGFRMPLGGAVIGQAAIEALVPQILPFGLYFDASDTLLSPKVPI